MARAGIELGEPRADGAVKSASTSSTVKLWKACASGSKRPAMVPGQVGSVRPVARSIQASVSPKVKTNTFRVRNIRRTCVR